MRWTRRAGREGMATVATVLALTCGGDDDGPSGNAGSIQVVLTPATISLPQGGSGSVTLSLTRGGGFGGAVTLTSAGLPTGVTTTITPAQLSGSTASATVDVSVAATVATGNYTGTITATAQGVAQTTATYQVTVTVAANYALTVSPAALSIAAGTAGSATVNIARTNFTGGVALALVNPPVGITSAFNPTPSTANSSTLALSVAASVAAGSYPLTIQGTATGPGVKSTTLALTVAAPPTGSSNIEYQFCDASQVPLFFAHQDGSGAWQSVTGFPSGSTIKFAFNVTQGRGGILTVFRTASSTSSNVLAVGRMRIGRQMTTRRARSSAALGRAATLRRSGIADVYSTEVVYASTAELIQDGIDNCAQTQPTKTVTGTVVGIGENAFGIFSLGSSTEAFQTGTGVPPSIALTFTDVPSGTIDFVGTRMAFVNNRGTPPNAAVLFRNLSVPNGGSLPSTIDFNGPSSTIPVTANATITGAGTDDLEIFTTLVTANSDMLFWFDFPPSTTATRPWAGLSAGTMIAGDFHGLLVFAAPHNDFPDVPVPTDFRVALKYVGPVTNQTLALGPGLSTPSTSQIVAGAYPRFRFQGTLPPDYNKGASVDVLGIQGAGNLYNIIASSAYLTAASNAFAYDFTMPDVAGLSGFPAGARLTGGANDIAVEGFGFTGPGIFDPRPALGSEFKAASKVAKITVP